MNRRAALQAFAATTGGILLREPVRAYSFVGGWAEELKPVGFATEINRDDFRHWIIQEDWSWRCPFTGERREGRWRVEVGSWERPRDFEPK